MLEKRGTPIDVVIELRVNDAVLIERIAGRFSCAKCGASYHDTFKQPKLAGTCDVCGSHDFIRRPDDKREVVSAPGWRPITGRPRRSCPTIRRRIACGWLTGWPISSAVAASIEAALETLPKRRLSHALTRS